MKWTPQEDAILRAHYEKGGSLTCRRNGLTRSQSGIANRAKALGISCDNAHAEAARRRIYGLPSCESPCPVPAHDYTDDDRAWRETRVPAINRGLLGWRFA